MTAAGFTRPGVSDGFLAAAGCHHVGGEECLNLYGFRAEGIAIQFHALDGNTVMDGDKPFARVRLYEPNESQKYYQRRDSGTHVYVPHTFRDAPHRSTLFVTEGEFKSLALAEAGFAAIGLCGINGAMRSMDGELRLQPELVEVFEHHKPARVVFVGDSDTVLNSDFAREASKLREAIFATKRFNFIEELCVAVCPLDGPKGIDDVRGTNSEQFGALFGALVESAFLIPSKASPAEVFCALLRREAERVQAAIRGDGHEHQRNTMKLLHSAGRIQRETGAMLKLKPLLAEILNIAESRVGSMIKDAGKPASEHVPDARPTKGSVTLRNVEAWEHPVNGDELLKEIAAFFKKFAVLPPHAGDVLAVWCLQSWCYELFDFAAIVAVWSPEHECGKGRVLDVAEKVVRRPFRTSNTSAAVLYHVISEGNLTVLVDEFDSVSHGQRDGICNILKGGFQANGMAHRMTERDGAQVVVEFPTYSPKMVATITLDKLDKATRSRSIGIRMQRKPRSQRVAKFRRVDGTVLQRKCMRWAQDNAEAIHVIPPMDVDECATDRQEDVWEPLVAIARVAGGDWEERIRSAAMHLTGGGSDGASETEGHQLLAALQSYFSEHGDRAETKKIITTLKESGDFDDVNYGRGLNPHFLAKALKPYGVEPGVHKMTGGKSARGYSRDDCEQAFSIYLSDAPAKTPLEKRNSVTAALIPDENSFFGNVTEENHDTSQNPVSSNENGPGYGVTFSKLKSDRAVENAAVLQPDMI